jgi:regulator of protease activity HflC (stomatin/prohibitin superfamily)
LDVTSVDKLVFRLAATVVYTIADPQQAFEANDREAHIRLALMTALTRLAAEHTLDAFLTDRAVLDEKLLAMVPSPVAGCAINAITITAVTLPPEIRRLFTEVERAKLEGLASLERARGEHAALRSLANAARMLKGNPELMNLRVLQALAAANGKRSQTLVLGQGSLLPIGNEAASSDE